MQTPTEIIIAAMEKAEEIEDIVIICRLKADSKRWDGISWQSNIENIHSRRCLLDEASTMMLIKSYGLLKDKD